MKSSLAMTAMVLIFVLGAQPVMAQQPYQPYPYLNPLPTSPYARPQLSPYLNLLRGGSPAANYYLGVVPERDRRRSERAFGTAIQDLERRAETPAQTGEELVPRLPSTGHPAYFLNYSSYFNLGGSSLTGVNTPRTTPRSSRGR